MKKLIIISFALFAMTACMNNTKKKDATKAKTEISQEKSCCEKDSTKTNTCDEKSKKSCCSETSEKKCCSKEDKTKSCSDSEKKCCSEEVAKSEKKESKCCSE
ncbi:MAG: hypothetical protein N4A49_17010 [Marinifilaceae bacterium]|jgi:hypothetical protein|nr:hypothetical protein [Marinifilaceae bacterium]